MLWERPQCLDPDVDLEKFHKRLALDGAISLCASILLLSCHLACCEPSWRSVQNSACGTCPLTARQVLNQRSALLSNYEVLTLLRELESDHLARTKTALRIKKEEEAAGHPPRHQAPPDDVCENLRTVEVEVSRLHSVPTSGARGRFITVVTSGYPVFVGRLPAHGLAEPRGHHAVDEEPRPVRPHQGGEAANSKPRSYRACGTLCGMSRGGAYTRILTTCVDCGGARRPIWG